YGWGGVSACPSLQSSNCGGAITSCSDIVTCLACLDDAAVRQTFTLTSGALAAGQFGTNSAVNACRRRIAKATSKFVGTIAKASSKCWQGRIKGQTSAACPVPGDARTASLLARAKQKQDAAICKACGGPDRTCDGNGDVAPSDVGFASSCPAVTIPGGSSCAGAIGTMAQLRDCVDCVTTFDDRCADAAAVPGQTAYPSQCGAAGSTTTTTI